MDGAGSLNKLWGQISSYTLKVLSSESSKHIVNKTERAIGLSIMTYHKTLMNPWITRGLTAAGFVNPAFFIGATGVSIYQTPFKFYNAVNEGTTEAYVDFGFHFAGTVTGARFHPAKYFSPTGQLIQDLPGIYRLQSKYTSVKIVPRLHGR